jgi:hypothetical protein
MLRIDLLRLPILNPWVIFAPLSSSILSMIPTQTRNSFFQFSDLKTGMPNGPRLTMKEIGGKLACRRSSDITVKGEPDGNLL